MSIRGTAIKQAETRYSPLRNHLTLEIKEIVWRNDLEQQPKVDVQITMKWLNESTVGPYIITQGKLLIDQEAIDGSKPWNVFSTSYLIFILKFGRQLKQRRGAAIVENYLSSQCLSITLCLKLYHAQYLLHISIVEKIYSSTSNFILSTPLTSQQIYHY